MQTIQDLLTPSVNLSAVIVPNLALALLAIAASALTLFTLSRSSKQILKMSAAILGLSPESTTLHSLSKKVSKFMKKLFLMPLVVISLAAIIASWVGFNGLEQLNTRITGEHLMTQGLWIGKFVLTLLTMVIITRVLRSAETRLRVKFEHLRGESASRLLNGLTQFVILLIWARAAILLSIEFGANETWSSRIESATEIGLLILGALLANRILDYAFDLVEGYLKSLLQKPHLKYLSSLISLLPIVEKAISFSIYIQVVRVVASYFQSLAIVQSIGGKVIETILYALASRVLVEGSTLFIHELFAGERAKATKNAESEARGKTFVPILRSIASYFIYFFAGVAILKAWGVDTGPILASAGILGFAIGMGAQKLTGDLVSGFFILFEGIYFVGHYIKVGDKEGAVESITIRTTSIRDASGILHSIPNGSINLASNYSTGSLECALRVKVAAHANYEQIKTLVLAEGKRMDDEFVDFLGPAKFNGITKIENGFTEIEIAAAVTPAKIAWAKAQLLERIPFALETAGVTVYEARTS